MAMFKKIMVPVDGSDHAVRAVALASELALRYGAELIVLHVIKKTGSSLVSKELEFYARVEHITLSELDRLETAANRIVAWAEAQAQQAGVRAVDQITEIGDPGPTIVDCANKNGVDLIVMGRRGLGRMTELLLGSVSHRVAQLADCACLTVK